MPLRTACVRNVTSFGGLAVGDKQVHVEVTQADIDKGIRKDSAACVVATAIARAFPDATRINVDLQTVRFTSNGERQVFLTPPPVIGYVVAFDAGEDIHPFGFRLRYDQMVNVRRKRKTEAGRAKARAREKVRRAEARHTSTQQRLAGLDVEAEAERRKARASERAARTERREAVAERDAVMAAYAGQVEAEPSDTTRRPSPGRVFARKERAYGLRLLRINQHTE
jgi:hypothetical protein